MKNNSIHINWKRASERENKEKKRGWCWWQRCRSRWLMKNVHIVKIYWLSTKRKEGKNKREKKTFCYLYVVLVYINTRVKEPQKEKNEIRKSIVLFFYFYFFPKNSFFWKSFSCLLWWKRIVFLGGGSVTGVKHCTHGIIRLLFRLSISLCCVSIPARHSKSEEEKKVDILSNDD